LSNSRIVGTNVSFLSCWVDYLPPWIWKPSVHSVKSHSYTLTLLCICISSVATLGNSRHFQLFLNFILITKGRHRKRIIRNSKLLKGKIWKGENLRCYSHKVDLISSRNYSIQNSTLKTSDLSQLVIPCIVVCKTAMPWIRAVTMNL
jgi:hypothetical protein